MNKKVLLNLRFLKDSCLFKDWIKEMINRTADENFVILTDDFHINFNSL